MIKSRFNIALIYMLVTVILVIQWTPSHAHLNAQHGHGEEIHQHVAEAHAHLPVYANLETIDVGHNQEDVSSVVEFNLDRIPVNSNIQDDSKSVLGISVCFTMPIPVRAEHLLEANNTQPRPSPPHIGEPRAPPQRS